VLQKEITVITRNRENVILNNWQGKYKKVLCVCSAGCLRSPTAAVVLSQEPYNFNTRSCGLTTEFAIIPIDEGLLCWADEIVCFAEFHAEDIRELLGKISPLTLEKKPVIVLNIADLYTYRQKELVDAIRTQYDEAMAN